MSHLQLFCPGLWTAEGPVVSFSGFPYPTRMAVIRLSGERLFIWSPIAPDPALLRETESLGKVAFLVSPNKIHHLALGEWRRAFPQAQLWASPGLPKKRPDLSFTGTLSDQPEPGWAGEIDQVHVTGSFMMSEIVFFHRESRTALFCDLIENFPPGWFKGWQGWVARLGGIVQPHVGAPGDWRITFWRRTAARQALARILAWHPMRVVVAHGQMVRTDGENFIRQAFRWL
jgi:hypothetical protein